MKLFQSWNELFPFYKARASASPRQFSTCTSFLKLLSSWKRKASTFTRRDEVPGPPRLDKFWAATTSDLGGFNLRSTHSYTYVATSTVSALLSLSRNYPFWQIPTMEQSRS